jgi:hypothetical protein
MLIFVLSFIKEFPYLTLLPSFRLVVVLVFVICFAESVLSHAFAIALTIARYRPIHHRLGRTSDHISRSRMFTAPFQAWILVEAPGFDADLEHSIFAGAACDF